MKMSPYYDVPDIKDLKQLIEYGAENYGEKEAFRFERKKEMVSVNYAELKADIDALGTYFYSIGLKDSKIVVYGENSYEWIITYFAAVGGSNVIVPIDKELGATELATLTNDSGAKAVVFSEAKSANVEEAKANIGCVEKYICMCEFADIIAKGRGMIAEGNNEYEENKIDPEKMCALIYTSGTTGNPKGVMLSNKNLATDMIQSCANLREPEGTVVVLPLNHTFGLMAGVLCQLVTGYPTYINSSVKNVLKDIQEMKPRHISVVPLYIETFYKKIWTSARKSGKDKILKVLIKVSNALRKVGIDLRKVFFKSVIDAFGGNLEMLITGGAPIEHKYLKGFEDIGIAVVNGYGITECSPIVATNRNKEYRFGSVGLAIPGVEVKVDNPNEDGEGELLVKGDIVMMGYYNNPEATKDAFDGEWFRTGDIGKVDEDGFIFITGRKKNIIILSNGKNIYPEELEAVILSVEGVTEVLVYGKNDSLCAEIYTETPQEKERIKKDVQALNASLPSQKQIKIVEFRDTEFEKTTTKKIKRFLH